MLRAVLIVSFLLTGCAKRPDMPHDEAIGLIQLDKEFRQ